jgi:hypothetical protein
MIGDRNEGAQASCRSAGKRRGVVVTKLSCWISHMFHRDDCAQENGSSEPNEAPNDRTRDLSKNRIGFDMFLDATSSNPSILFGIRGEREPYFPGCFNPFFEVAVANDNRLVLSLHEKKLAGLANCRAMGSHCDARKKLSRENPARWLRLLVGPRTRHTPRHPHQPVFIKSLQKPPNSFDAPPR